MTEKKEPTNPDRPLDNENRYLPSSIARYLPGKVMASYVEDCVGRPELRKRLQRAQEWQSVDMFHNRRGILCRKMPRGVSPQIMELGEMSAHWLNKCSDLPIKNQEHPQDLKTALYLADKLDWAQTRIKYLEDLLEKASGPVSA